ELGLAEAAQPAQRDAEAAIGRAHEAAPAAAADAWSNPASSAGGCALRAGGMVAPVDAMRAASKRRIVLRRDAGAQTQAGAAASRNALRPVAEPIASAARRCAAAGCARDARAYL